MENQKIIIGLLIIIIVILVIGVIMFSSFANKEDSNLSIADKKIYEGDSLVVVLSDSNGKGIANTTVNIKLTDNNGIVIDENVTTNDQGKAKLKITEKGKYCVECDYDGNNQYSPSTTAGNLTVKKVQTKHVSHKTSGSADDWVYGTGAGASDDPDIHWKRNKKTGYTEYYNEKTGETWGGYNIA